MSAMEPDPDLVRIGQSPEWIQWFEEALAYFEDQRWPREDWSNRSWRPIGIQGDSIPQIVEHDQRAHVRHDLVPLVRTAIRDYSISQHPWGFTP